MKRHSRMKRQLDEQTKSRADNSAVVRWTCSAVFVLTSHVLTFAADASAQDDAQALQQQASWEPSNAAQIRAQILAWVAENEVSELDQLKIETLCEDTQIETSASESSLDLLSMVVPLARPSASDFVNGLVGYRQTTASPKVDELDQFSDDSFLDSNLRVLYGRWLCQNEFYDEALMVVEDVQLDSVIDPAALLFYRGVAAQRLLDKEQTIGTLEKLLENRGQIPVRYERLADLMLADLRPLEEDTLDEIARLMEDVQRRQSLHRSGTQVREEEARVVEKLEKLIKDLEEKMNPSPSPSSSSSPPSSPMEQSRAGGGGGAAGNVDRKSQTPGKQWGNLDPHDRSAALAELAKDLPAHYREVIEEYFRRLAEDEKEIPR